MYRMSWKEARQHRGLWVHWQAPPPRWEVLIVWARRDMPGELPWWHVSWLSPTLPVPGHCLGPKRTALQNIYTHTEEAPPFRKSPKRQLSSVQEPKILLLLLSYWLILAPGTRDYHPLWCHCFCWWRKKSVTNLRPPFTKHYHTYRSASL